MKEDNFPLSTSCVQNLLDRQYIYITMCGYLLVQGNFRPWLLDFLLPHPLRLISNNPEVSVEVLAEMSQQLSVSQRNQAIRLLSSMDAEHKDKWKHFFLKIFCGTWYCKVMYILLFLFWLWVER